MSSFLKAKVERKKNLQNRRDVTTRFITQFLLATGRESINLPSLDKFVTRELSYIKYRCYGGWDSALRASAVLQQKIRLKLEKCFDEMLHHGAHGPWLRVASRDAVRAFAAYLVLQMQDKMKKVEQTQVENLGIENQDITDQIIELLGTPNKDIADELACEMVLKKQSTYTGYAMIEFLDLLKSEREEELLQNKMKKQREEEAVRAVLPVPVPQLEAPVPPAAQVVPAQAFVFTFTYTAPPSVPKPPRVTWLGEKRSNFVPRDVLKIEVKLSGRVGIMVHLRGGSKYCDLEQRVLHDAHMNSEVTRSTFPSGFTLCDRDGYPLRNFATALGNLDLPRGTVYLVATPGANGCAPSTSLHGFNMYIAEQRHVWPPVAPQSHGSTHSSTRAGHVGVEDAIRLIMQACRGRVQRLELQIGNVRRLIDVSSPCIDKIEGDIRTTLYSTAFVTASAPHHQYKPYLNVSLRKFLSLRSLCTSCHSTVTFPQVLRIMNGESELLGTPTNTQPTHIQQRLNAQSGLNEYFCRCAEMANI